MKKTIYLQIILSAAATFSIQQAIGMKQHNRRGPVTVIVRNEETFAIGAIRHSPCGYPYSIINSKPKKTPPQRKVLPTTIPEEQ